MDRGGVQQRASTSGKGKKRHNQQKWVEGLTTWTPTLEGATIDSMARACRSKLRFSDKKVQERRVVSSEGESNVPGLASNHDDKLEDWVRAWEWHQVSNGPDCVLPDRHGGRGRGRYVVTCHARTIVPCWMPSQPVPGCHVPTNDAILTCRFVNWVYW